MPVKYMLEISNYPLDPKWQHFYFLHMDLIIPYQTQETWNASGISQKLYS